MTSQITRAAAPVREFDHHNCPGVTSDPFSAYERVRGDRIFWTPAYDGFWMLTRYDDIRSVLADPSTFSSRTGSIPAAGWPRPLIPEELDPPHHRKYRTLVNRCLAGAAGDLITAAIRKECAALAERLEPRGECDLVTDYSRPIQHALFATLFAVPRAHATTCATWVADLLQHRDKGRRLRAVGAIMDYLVEDIANREGRLPSSGDTGLIAALTSARLDGQPLSGEEIVDIAFLVVMASLDTLANSLNFSFRHLAGHPAQQHRIATDPDCGAHATGELLRLHSVVNIARTATRDTTVAGVQIAAGDRLLLCLSLAGRDPDTYGQPTILDFDRPSSPGHLAFGAGPHRCLGSRIATDALTAALREWHLRIPAYGIPASAVIHTGGGAVCSLDSLPVVWAAGG